MRVRLAITIAVLACSALVSAQVEAPTLSPHDHDRIRLAEAVVANSELRVQLLQAHLALAQGQVREAQAQLQQTIAGLARDGYRLQRDGAGAWTYIAVDSPPQEPQP